MGLDARVQKLLGTTIDDIGAALEAGDRGTARQLVREYAPQIADLAPNAEPYTAPETDPAKLADFIPRF
jgi:hypothetical protein